MDDCFVTGRVWHRRRAPRVHAFNYRLYFSLLDVETLPETFRRSRWWSIERFNLVCFRRSDYLGPPDQPLADALRDRVQSESGQRPSGRIFMLTHLRQWGLAFNPVTFYFCHDQGRLAFIVAEIHNTPWGERHAYVLDCRDQAGPEYRFCFDKVFHVSPFLPMQLGYDWRFSVDQDRLDVHMLVTEQGAECFSAGMRLSPQPITSSAMRTMPLRFPLVCFKVLAGIYWQAFRLWLKRIPLHTHPDKESDTA
jgi:uncharacterized protein